jgi:putative transposase
MPRSNRYILPGRIYHITHRCHNRDWLLKFKKDREAYRNWLRDGVSRYKLSILGYCITSNHIHLMLYAWTTQAVSQFMQLVQGSFAQEYNSRKERKGAYWEDRFHCTMIDTGRYFWNCLAYIDLNMVRAGVVSHPESWEWNGYQEIMDRRKRYRILDIAAVLNKSGLKTLEDFRTKYREELNYHLSKGKLQRQPQWTESLAVGSEAFIDRLKPFWERRRTKLLQDEISPGIWTIQEEKASYGS